MLISLQSVRGVNNLSESLDGLLPRLKFRTNVGQAITLPGIKKK